MWHQGLLDFSLWQIVLATLIMTHATIVCVTVYLHRHSAHRALDIHPALALVFRAWLWLTTGMDTKAWTAVHRKHHAKCETAEDPHSPAVLGIDKVLWQGAELYRAGIDDETLEKYGKGTPADWLERNVFSNRTKTGLGIMLIADVALFGVIGITVWAVQMLWIPFLAAGIINGLGHHTGYRNFEVPDASTNIVPWGILIGGEELHNNHHTYPSSAKLSVKWWELDAGWFWIRLFSALGLARVKKLPPVIHEVSGKAEIDGDTTTAVLDNRFQVMARYARTVVVPLVEQERARADALTADLFDRARAVICRHQALVDAHGQQQLRRALSQSHVLEVIYEKRLELQALWEKRDATADEIIASLTEWCRRAEESGIQALADFARSLRRYSTAPAPA